MLSNIWDGEGWHWEGVFEPQAAFRAAARVGEPNLMRNSNYYNYGSLKTTNRNLITINNNVIRKA